jgi:hypothetical protein
VWRVSIDKQKEREGRLTLFCDFWSAAWSWIHCTPKSVAFAAWPQLSGYSCVAPSALTSTCEIRIINPRGTCRSRQS